MGSRQKFENCRPRPLISGLKCWTALLPQYCWNVGVASETSVSTLSLHTAPCYWLILNFVTPFWRREYPLRPNKDDISTFKHFAGVPFIWYLSFLFQWTFFLIKLQKLRTEAIVTQWQLYTYKMLDQHPCISPFPLAEFLFWNQWLLRSGQFREWKSFCSSLAWLAKKFD